MIKKIHRVVHHR